MGNAINVQCGDVLSGRCWDCISKNSQYISRLEDNLVALTGARDRLTALKSDVMQNVINQQRPQMEQTGEVARWLTTVDATVPQVNGLLNRGDLERGNLCMAGYCSTNCMFTYNFGKSVASSLVRVNSLVEADFKQLVVEAPANKLQSDLQELSREEVYLRALKEDLQQRISSEKGTEKRTAEQVKVWLSNAENLLAEADQLRQDGPEQHTKLVGGDISNYIFVGTVAQKLEEIKSLMARGRFDEVTVKAGPRRVVRRNHKPTVGTKEMLEKAWSHLHNVEVGILGIYGMGGVGKTTLLTLINNKFASDRNDFDVVIWVELSKDLKLDRIQESIWKQIRSLDEGWLKRSSPEKAQDIYDELQSKKFVLLLDNVWEHIELETIGIPLDIYQNGSKVVLTARSSAVCNQMKARPTMKVEPLKWEEAWQLFEEYVGNKDALIKPVAENIAKECCGLPIALITVGRATAGMYKLEEWEHALDVLRRSNSNIQCMDDQLYKDMEVKVFELLKFSYDCLHNDTLRSCFIYCALFPEDFKILKDDLVRYWVAEKFCNRGEGYTNLYSLIRQCLFEEEGECVKLHDVIRDMAVWIACKREKEIHKFFIQAGVKLFQLPSVEEWAVAKKVSFMASSLTSVEGSPPSSDLVTLFLSHTNLKIISEGFFQCMTRLTVLDLSHSRIEALPLAISKLQSLEYLNLSYTNLMKLPVEMESLIRLIYLNLEGTSCLLMIPVEVISNLSELQVFIMFRCSSVFNKGGENRFIEELMCLENLCELSLTVRSASFLESICSNQKLLDCMRALQLCISKDTKSLNISSLAKAKQLHVLDIYVNQHLEELITEESKPHGPSSSLNNNQLSFCGLREVNVINNNSMLHMTWLIFAPNLTILRAKNNEKMEEIISTEKLSKQVWGEHLNMFEKLQVLDLEWLSKLKSIFPITLSFPCLIQMNVRECPALKKLPLNAESAEGCSVVIRGEQSWWNKLTWEDRETQDAFSSSFQNI